MYQLSQYLSMPLTHICGLFLQEGDIGLEFEVEGKNVLPWHNNLWKCKPDGSLRGGFEWILIKPLSVDKTESAIDQWFTKKKENEMETPFSHRTSIHVHVNATKFILKQVYQVITAYWLVEDLLCKFSGPTREGNLFCLRVRDADYAMTKLCEGIKNGTFFYNMNSDEFKYAALNLQAIAKYGSFEFRMMRGMYDDPIFIKDWVKALYTLVHSSANNFNSPLEIIKAYEDNPYAFLNKIFGLHFAMKLRGQHEFWKEMMDEQYHHAFTLATTPDSWEANSYPSTADPYSAIQTTTIKEKYKHPKKKINTAWNPAPEPSYEEDDEPESDWVNSDEILDSLDSEEVEF